MGSTCLVDEISRGDGDPCVDIYILVCMCSLNFNEFMGNKASLIGV